MINNMTDHNTPCGWNLNWLPQPLSDMFLPNFIEICTNETICALLTRNLNLLPRQF